MDYDTILNTVGEKPEHMYRTERGSTYAHYKDNTTVRNRSGKNHKDKAEGLQPRSGRTVYMHPDDVNKMAGMYQNSELSTAFKPTSYDKETKTGKVALTHAEDYGPKKAGSVIHEAHFTTKPAVGLNPVEIYRSESPKGDPGKGVHWGTKITEVRGGGSGSRGGGGGSIGTQSQMGGGGSGLRGGGGGGSNVAERPNFSHDMSSINDRPKINKLPLPAPYVVGPEHYKNGGAVSMPKEYSAGSWKLI